MDALIIAAAGLSSRMGDFKPLLPLGSSTIIQTLIEGYRQAGVEHIFVVTGRDAGELENALGHDGIVFVRNPQFAQTDMFASLMLGVECYLEHNRPAQNGKVFITPADIPLVLPSTIAALRAHDALACVPAFEGAPGHPICLKEELLLELGSYQGNCGLRGALETAGATIQQLETDDEGILYDADTPKDYQVICRLYEKQLQAELR